MAVYRFKVSFEDYDEVVRVIDVKSSQNFVDLHKAIHQSISYDAEKPSSFFVSSDTWIKGDEIAYLPSQKKIDKGVVLMENSKFSKFIEDPHQKFYYIYNFEDPFDFHVELIQIILQADDQIQYPFLVNSIGVAPKIFNPNQNTESETVAPQNEFDFLNETSFEVADEDEIGALSDMGVNDDTSTSKDADEEEEDEFGDDFSDNNHFDDEDQY